MGQYFIIVNPRKQQFLIPEKFASGCKLIEMVSVPYGPLAALAYLTVDNSNGAGAGDLIVSKRLAKYKLIGSWFGDPICIAGDYGELISDNEALRQLVGYAVPQDCNLYQLAHKMYADISDDLIRVVAKSNSDHPWVCVDMSKDADRRCVPAYGTLPLTPPKKPAGGLTNYARYLTTANPVQEQIAAQIGWLLSRHPELTPESFLKPINDSIQRAMENRNG